MWKLGNKGSTIIEAVIIMPIVVLIIFMLIRMMVALVEEGGLRYNMEAAAFHRAAYDKDIEIEASSDIYGNSSIECITVSGDEIIVKGSNSNHIGVIYTSKPLVASHRVVVRKNNVYERLREWQILEEILS